MSVRPDRDAVSVSAVSVSAVSVSGWVQAVAAACGATTVIADDALAASPGGARAVRVVTPVAAAEGAERVDLVVSFDAPGQGAGWEAYFAALARRAEKSLLVVVRNAERPGQGTAPDTTAIARVLWQVGRVRQHVYLGVPRLIAPAGVVPVPAGLLVRRTARLHAFVVDTAPRTPQARRKLRTVATGPAGA